MSEMLTGEGGPERCCSLTNSPILRIYCDINDEEEQDEEDVSLWRFWPKGVGKGVYHGEVIRKHPGRFRGRRPFTN